MRAAARFNFERTGNRADMQLLCCFPILLAVHDGAL